MSIQLTPLTDDQIVAAQIRRIRGDFGRFVLDLRFSEGTSSRRVRGAVEDFNRDRPLKDLRRSEAVPQTAAAQDQSR